MVQLTYLPTVIYGVKLGSVTPMEEWFYGVWIKSAEEDEGGCVITLKRSIRGSS